MANKIEDNEEIIESTVDQNLKKKQKKKRKKVLGVKVLEYCLL